MKDPIVLLQESEAKLTEANAKVAKLEGELKESQKATAKTKLTGLMKEASLPEVAQNRLFDAFKEATTDAGMKEAVNSEAAYIKSLGGNVKRNNGAADPINEADGQMKDYRQRQFRAYVASGMKESEAKKIAGIE